MYLEHSGLSSYPFVNSSDPAFFLAQGQYRNALSALLYGILYEKGLMVLAGPSGCGKTTLCYALKDKLNPEEYLTCHLVYPGFKSIEIFRYLAGELGIDPTDGSLLSQTVAIKSRLTELRSKGVRCVLIIDEAQEMGPKAFQEVHFLTNMETSRTKLIQIILMGRSQLATMIEAPEFGALRQRVTNMLALKPLSRVETFLYISHRLRVAGRKKPLFTKQAAELVYAISKGVPRVINKISDMALLKAFLTEVHVIEAENIVQTAQDLGLELPRGTWSAGAAVRPKAAVLDAEPAGQVSGESQALPEAAVSRAKPPDSVPVKPDAEEEPAPRMEAVSSGKSDEPPAQASEGRRLVRMGILASLLVLALSVALWQEKSARWPHLSPIYKMVLSKRGVASLGPAEMGKEDGKEDLALPPDANSLKMAERERNNPTPPADEQLDSSSLENPPSAIPASSSVSQTEPPPLDPAAAEKPEPDERQDSAASGEQASRLSPADPTLDASTRSSFYPYSLRVSTLHKKQTADKLKNELKRQGIDSYWCAGKFSNNKVAFKVYRGYFKNKAEAVASKNQYNLNTSVVELTPYAILAGASLDEAESDRLSSKLSGLDYCPYVFQNEDGSRLLLIGAYRNMDEGVEALGELRKNGIEGKVIER